MASLEISPELLRQLQERAAQTNMSVDDLLIQWLLRDNRQQPSTLALIDQVSDAIIVTDTQLHITVWNTAAQRIYGWNTAEALGEVLDVLVKTEWTMETQAQAQATLMQTGLWQGEVIQYTRSGTALTIMASVSWLRDKHGEIIGGITVNRDITARKQAEEALRQSEAKLQSLLESQNAYVCRTNLAGKFTYGNKRLLEKSGFTAEEFVGMNSLETVLLDDHPKTLETIRRCLQNPNIPQQVVLRKPARYGGQYTSLWEFTALTDETGKPTEVLCIGFDITEQIIAQTALHESEERYRTIVETAHEGIWLLDATAHTIYVNQRLADMLGYSPDDMLGRQFLDFMTPENQKTALYYLERRQQGITEQHDFCFQHRDGSEVWVTIATNPIFDAAGAYQGTLGMLMDITARKQTEALKLEQERLKAILYREQEWNILMHRAVAALDHDIRTPLSVIATSKNILENYPNQMDAEKRQEKLDAIGRQLDYVLQMINDLTTMMTGNLSDRPFTPKIANIAVLCQIIVTEIQTTIGNQHQFIFKNIPPIFSASIDEVLVSRILLNLLSNAVKYSPQNTTIVLELDKQDQAIVLRVIDEGMGIHPKDHAQIFEAFFRTANVAAIAGTGLGLNIVLDCVQRHQGSIHVESELGKGAAFIVYLPQPPL